MKYQANVPNTGRHRFPKPEVQAALVREKRDVFIKPGLVGGAMGALVYALLEALTQWL